MKHETAARRALWFGASGAAVSAALLLVCGLLAVLAEVDVGLPVLVGGLAVVPVAAGVGALPQLRRRTGYALAAAAFAVLLAVVVLAGAALAVLLAGRLPRGTERDVVGPALLAGTVGAVLFGLLLPRVRAAATALADPRHGRPESVVRNFAERSSRGAGEDDLLDLADSLRRTMGVRAAEIWRVEGLELRRVASSPNRGGQAVAMRAVQQDALAQSDIAGPAWLRLWLPELAADRSTLELRAVAAAHFGRLLGVVVVEKPAGEAFTGVEDRALVDLGQRLGTVLGNIELDSQLRQTLSDLQRANETLQASRARLVEAADAERRRIERDLHDGAQQQLVALAINISLIRTLLADDPAKADELLVALAGQLRDTIDEVRELAHGIYPPALAHGGLPDALRSVIGRSPGRISLAADDVQRYAPATEAAVYYCCLEAIQNSAKHAPDAAVTIALTGTATRLTFAAADDGPGYDPARVQHSHGLENMSDRVGALGGEVGWTSAPGRGVTVSGWVPARVVED